MADEKPVVNPRPDGTGIRKNVSRRSIAPTYNFMGDNALDRLFQGISYDTPVNEIQEMFYEASILIERMTRINNVPTPQVSQENYNLMTPRQERNFYSEIYKMQ